MRYRPAAQKISIVCAQAESAAQVFGEFVVFGDVANKKLGGIHERKVLRPGGRQPVLLEQFRAFDAHDLDGHSARVRGRVRLRIFVAAREADPSLIRGYVGILEKAVAQSRIQIVQHREGRLETSVGFRMHVTPVGLRRCTRGRGAPTLGRGAGSGNFGRISRERMKGHVALAGIHHFQRRSYDLRSQVALGRSSGLTHRFGRTGAEQVIAERQDHDQSKDSAYASRGQACLLITMTIGRG